MKFDKFDKNTVKLIFRFHFNTFLYFHGFDKLLRWLISFDIINPLILAMSSNNGSSSKYNREEVYENDDNTEQQTLHVQRKKEINIINSSMGELEEETEEVNTKSELKVILFHTIYFYIYFSDVFFL